MLSEEIRAWIVENQDPDYAALQRRLLPTLDESAIVGVRTPALRSYARQLAKQAEVSAFLAELPHRLFEENQLHAFLLEMEKDFSRCLAGVEGFLPYVDNWATCDQMSPPIFKKHLPELLPRIEAWLTSDREYTVRFGMEMLMQHYLDDAFDPRYPQLVVQAKSQAYYVRMMVAWYFATALAKQYDAALPYLEQDRMETWTHNKTIQKALESYRISPEQKAYLKTLRRK